MCDTLKQTQPIPSTLEALQLVLSRCDEFATQQRFEQLLDTVAPGDHRTPLRAADPRRRAELVTGRLSETWQGGQNVLQTLVRRVAASCGAQTAHGRALRALLARFTAEQEASDEAAWRRGEHYLAQLEQRPAAGLLAAYLAERRPVGHHEQIEWRLAELALDMPLEDHALELDRPDLAERRAGAALLWSLAQRLRRPGPPAECLMAGAPLTVRQAEIVARAWALWPNNPCFREESLCTRLADWFSACGHSLLPIVPVLIAAGHAALAVACVRHNVCTTTYQATLEAALALLEQPVCWDEGRRLLSSLIVATGKQPDQLRTLGRAAFAQGCYNEVISVVMLLARQGAADQEVLAWQIAARASLGGYKRAADLYAAAWPDRPDTPPFPYPRQLLPALRTPETAALRRRLLRSVDLDLLDERQRLEALAARGQAEHTLAAWARLLRRQIGTLSGMDWRATADNSDTLDLLIQLTEACLQSRADRPERLYAVTIWQSLRDDDQLAGMSAAARVLLEPDHERCTRVYEHWMPPEVPPDPVAAHWVQRATQRYLEALAQQRRWDDARRFLEEHHTQQLLGQIAPDEQRYWRLLHDLEQALIENLCVQEYGRFWERTLCLDLPDRYICLLVEHFANRRPLGRPEEQRRLDDLALHIERRGKALGERLLIELPRVCKHHVHAHLAASDLHTLGHLLRRLTHNPEECYDCVHHAGGLPDLRGHHHRHRPGRDDQGTGQLEHADTA